MLFSWPCVLVGLTRKWFEVKIFTSNHFRTHAQRERERSHPDHATNPEPKAFWLRTLRLRRSTSTSNRTLWLRQRTQSLELFDFTPFDFVIWLQLQIAPRSHPSTSPANPEPRSRLRLHRDRTLRSHRDRTDHTKIAPHDRTMTAPIAPRRHRLHWDRNWEMVGFWWILPDLMNFFWLGFVSVFIYWEMVLYICLEAEKMWGTRRKCVFYIIFSNTTKH